MYTFLQAATLDLLKQLGSPHESLKAVHVAGSKGKGSVSSFLSSILSQSGLKTGLYTSPHMHSIRERLQIVGTGPISEPAYAKLIQDAAPAIAATRTRFPLTHFEALTALSLRYFADQGCEAVVLETGLGGIRDATNVLPPSAVAAAILTSIGMEHVEALGGSLQSIAEAKAGIAKSGRPVVIGRQDESEALATLRRVAGARGAGPIIYAPEHVQVEAVGTQRESGWPSVLSERIRISHRSPGEEAPSSSASSVIETSTYMLGPHQRDNIATAVATIHALQRARAFGREISAEHIAKGIAAAYMPGRFQVIRRSKGGDGLVVLDGTGRFLVSTFSVFVVHMHTLIQFDRRFFFGIDIHCVLVSGQRSSYRCIEKKNDHECSISFLKVSKTNHNYIKKINQKSGAHTVASARALVDSLAAYLPGRRLALVIACAADKDHVGILTELRKARPSVVIFASTAIAGASQRSAGPGQLVAAWQKAAGAEGAPLLRCRELLGASVFSGVDRAGRELSAFPGEPGVVVVTGSLHAVAEALKLDM